MSPLDYFLPFVNDRMLTSIVQETNMFAVQCLTANGKDPNSWVAVALKELKAILGLIIAMSIPKNSLIVILSTCVVIAIFTLIFLLLAWLFN